MSGNHEQRMPPLDAVYESLAETIEGWAAGFGTEMTYTDPVLEESGPNEWASALRKSCDWALRTADSILVGQGRFDHAKDLKRRMGELCDAADGYEQRLDAMEDQCRVRIEGIAARHRELFGDDDPDAHRLWKLCQGIQRIWTFGLDDSGPQTPKEFAEAVDRALFEEQGSKDRAEAEMQRLARELVEHLRLMATMERGPNHAPSSQDQAMSDTEASPDLKDEKFGGPQHDPQDTRVALWMGKRIYLGNDTHISRLFWLLASPPGRPRSPAKIQQAVDQMETTEFVGSSAEDIRKSQLRVRKAISN